MPRRASRWTYHAGEKGRNRVRAFEHRLGTLHLEYMDQGQRRSQALGHRDRDRAKQQADGLAAEFANPKRVREPDELTIGELFDNYLQEVTPGKGSEKQSQDRRVVRLWLDVVPKARLAISLKESDALAFIRERRARGDLRPGKGGCRRNAVIQPRSWQSDIAFLKTVLRWAVSNGFVTRYPGILAFRDRTKKTVRRPIISDNEYDQLWAVADRVGAGVRCLLVLAHETGHRIGSIRQLKWTDVDLGKPEVHWRAELDKIGLDHKTPLTPEAVGALRHLREQSGVVGDVWVFPAPKSFGPVSKHLVRKWWQRMEKLAGLPKLAGRGWHSLRRKFATDLKHQPPADVAAVGGWKDTTTIMRSYQQADAATMRHILMNRRAPITGATAEATAEVPDIAPKTPLPRVARKLGRAVS